MNFIKFTKQLTTAKSIPAIHQVLQNKLAEFAISTFAFTYYGSHPKSHNKIKYEYCSANFRPWHQHYLCENYHNIDSTIDEVYQTNLPVYWELAQQLKQAKTKREKNMRQDSIAFGIEKGLSIPLYGNDNDFAILLLVQIKQEKSLNKWQEIQYELFVIAHLYFDTLKSKLAVALSKNDLCLLTDRELQCLALTAKDYHVSEIAKKLNISQRTVNFHLQNVNKKLGTRNKHQSVVKAIKKGLLA